MFGRRSAKNKAIINFTWHAVSSPVTLQSLPFTHLTTWWRSKFADVYAQCSQSAKWQRAQFKYVQTFTEMQR